MKKNRLSFLAFIVFSSSATVALAAPPAPAVPAGHPKIDYPAQSTTHQQSAPISGTVLQAMNSGGYSYIHLQKNSGEKVWLAVTETRVNVGDRMSFMEGLVMKNFESKTLKRTFDSIIFSNGVIPQAKAAAPAAPAAAAAPTKAQAAAMGSKVAVKAKEAKISVKKAVGPNAYTIAEAYRNSAKLNNKQVAIRGKVVKVTPRIMKKNWIHIQDGSGSQAKGTHNLVCTTTATARVGDVVTVRGTLAKDRDFGYGYRYSVIVENAAIGK
ncbi:DNA-binding protein [Geobacter sp. FeAm09]|uniref:OB-fold nucleic acid binding domain-containing protein n=1 Tax=Geobacter sp. FeAm09 TaxID=2597769 RepID=UPI0011ED3593|nr:DNA-binding protein [Geobacter sp. FeAm09]QEM67766.1 DNA-binding protein [Geobacter sp. FeAm09]